MDSLEDTPKRIEEAYHEIEEATTQKARERGYTTLFGFIRQCHQQGRLYHALDPLETLKIKSREEWVKKQRGLIDDHKKRIEASKDKARVEAIWNAVIEVLYKENLGLQVKEDQVLKRDDKQLVISWEGKCPKSLCPVLRYGSDLPIDHVCRGAYHRPYEVILNEIDDNLWFNRTYGNLRPKGRRCIEIVEYKDFLALFHDSHETFGFGETGRETFARLGEQRGGLLPQEICIPKRVKDTALLADMIKNERVHLLRGLEWEDYHSPILLSREEAVRLNVHSILVQSPKPGLGAFIPDLTFWILWAENVDEWIGVRYWNRETAGGYPELKGPYGIRNTVLATDILKAYGITKGITPEEAVKTHPLKLEYIATHQNC